MLKHRSGMLAHALCLVIGLLCVADAAMAQVSITPDSMVNPALSDLRAAMGGPSDHGPGMSFDVKMTGQASSAHQKELAELSFKTQDGLAKIGIARGGNVYSWTLDGVEFMPPQSNWFSQFVDDVFQIVLTRRGEGRKRRTGGWQSDDPFFIHQGGSYAQRIRPGSKNVYAAPIAYEFDVKEAALYVLSWPQQGHVPRRLRSDFMFLSRIERVADSLLEFDVLIFNVGSEQLDFGNFPWGGVRSSVAPGLWRLHNGMFESLPTSHFSGGAKVVNEQAQAVFMWAGNEPGSLAFGLGAPSRVMGGSNKRAPRTQWRWGFASGPGGPRVRDFMVGSNNAGTVVSPGTVLRVRYYIGAGRRANIEKQLQSSVVSPYLGAVETKPTADDGNICITESGSGLKMAAETAETGGCAIETSLRFGRNARPLIVFRSKDGSAMSIADDLYFGVASTGDGMDIPGRRWIPSNFIGFGTDLVKGDRCAAASAGPSAPSATAAALADGAVCGARAVK